MKVRLMTIIVGATMFGAHSVSAQVLENDVKQFDIEATEQMLSSPVPLVENELVTPSNIDIAVFDPTISYYVQNLNLTPKQLDEALRISEEGQAKKEDLLQKIEELRHEANNLEAKSLIAFEAILTDDQKVAFHRLRSAIEHANTAEQDTHHAEADSDTKE